MFRKRQAAAAEDEISDDILASIPDLDEPQPVGAAYGEPQEARPARENRAVWQDVAYEAAGRGARNLDVDVSNLVAEVRRQMDTVFSRELSKVEDSLGGKLRQMESMLVQAQAELDGLRGENKALQGVKAEYERKIHALKDLTRSIEKL